MRSFWKPRLAELLITLGAFIFCWIYFTTVGGEEAGSIPFNMAGRQFSNFCFINYFYLSYFGVSYIYKFFYALFPSYNCLGIAFILFELLSLYLVLRAMKKIVFASTSNIYVVTAVQIIFAIFFTENVVVLSHTRFCFILCGMSLFNLAFQDKITWKDVVLNTLIFIAGLLNRPESGVGMLALVGLGYLVHRFNLVHIIRRMFFPGLVVAIMLVAFAVDWATTNTFVRKVEPEVEYKVMAHRVVDISVMKTAADSIKYQLAIHGMWFDPRVLTTTFLRSILLPGSDLSPAHAYAVFLHVLSLYTYCVFVPVCVIVLFLLALFQGRRFTALKIMVFQFITFCILYYSDYNGFLIANRHFLNLQLIYLLIACYYFFSENPVQARDTKYKWLAGMAWLLVGLSAVITISNYKENNNQALMDIAGKERVMEKIESTYSGRNIIVTLAGFQIFDHRFTPRNKIYTKNNYVLYDVLAHQLLPVYMNYLNSQCQCDALDPVAFFNWASDSHALYMSDSSQYNLTEKYMQVVHSDRVKFISPVSLNTLAGTDNFDTRGIELREVIIEK